MNLEELKKQRDKLNAQIEALENQWPKEGDEVLVDKTLFQNLFKACEFYYQYREGNHPYDVEDKKRAFKLRTKIITDANKLVISYKSTPPTGCENDK